MPESNISVPVELLLNSDLTTTARLVTIFLLYYRDPECAVCRPRRSLIAERLGISLPTVGRALKQLREAGVVQVCPSWGHIPRYEVLPYTPKRDMRRAEVARG